MEALAEKDILIFVSTSGKDTNPGTQARPIRTFGEAVRRLQPLWLKKQRIIFAPGRYEVGKTDAVDPKMFYIHLGHQVGGEGEPLVIQGAFKTELSGVVQTQEGNTFTDKSLSLLGPDKHAGARVRFISGPLTGQAYLIHGNIGKTIKVVGTLGQGIVGARYVIERPAVIIEYEQGLVFEGGGATELFMTGINWMPKDAKAGAKNFFQVNGGIKLFAEGCEWDMRGGIFQASQTANVIFGGNVL